MTAKEIQELDKTYNEVILGKNNPSAAVIQCTECNKSFVLIYGRTNNICYHLLQKLKLNGFL